MDEQETAVAVRVELERKAEHLSLAGRVSVPLYCQLGASTQSMLRVDFQHRAAEYASEHTDSQYDSLHARCSEPE